MNDKPEEDAPNARVIPPPDSYSSCWSVSDIFHISQHEANEKRSNLKRVGLTHRPVLAPQNFRESPPVAIQGIPFAYSDQRKGFGTGRICKSKSVSIRLMKAKARLERSKSSLPRIVIPPALKFDPSQEIDTEMSESLGVPLVALR
ncbi:hypothetical protein B0H13DRAFT_1899891 [Mycena leptocephala]|nr:hypothetical protein B0H13DRAFT_1899891 [Mycena leptocephala]